MSLVIFMVSLLLFCFFIFRFEEEEQLYQPVPEKDQPSRGQKLLPCGKSKQRGNTQQQPAIGRENGEQDPKGSASEPFPTNGALLVKAPAGIQELGKQRTREQAGGASR
jgi:hypothetical protein